MRRSLFEALNRLSKHAHMLKPRLIHKAKRIPHVNVLIQGAMEERFVLHPFSEFVTPIIQR